MEIIYLPSFIREFKHLDPSLQKEALEKIELFKNPENHRQLKVHKLKGRLKGRYSFSINYKTHVVFIFVSKHEAALLTIGSHDMYK